MPSLARDTGVSDSSRFSPFHIKFQQGAPGTNQEGEPRNHFRRYRKEAWGDVERALRQGKGGVQAKKRISPDFGG